MLIDWTDPAGLDAVEARNGPRAANMMSVYGPMVHTLMACAEGPFRLESIKRLMATNGFETVAESRYQDIVMNVIRFINASAAPYYVQRIAKGLRFHWRMIPVDPSAKQPLRNADFEHAAKSRPIVTRPIESRRAQPSSHATAHTAISKAASDAEFIDIIKHADDVPITMDEDVIIGAMQDQIKKCGYAPGFVKNMERAMTLYYDIVRLGVLDSDDVLMAGWDETRLREMFKRRFQLGAVAPATQSIELDL